MTLSVRNTFFKGGILLSALSLALAAGGAYFAFPALPQAVESAPPSGVFQGLAETFGLSSPYIPLFAILGAVLYSLVSIILIYYFFEKTQSPELIFAAFFVMSLSFELFRILVPLKMVFPLPAMYLISASRIVLFGRYFGLFSLFAASVYAAGLDAQKQENAFLLLVLATLMISLNIPLDSLVWDSTFMFSTAYPVMFFLIEAAIIGATVISFLVSAYIRSTRAYILIGLGSLMALGGRFLLLGSDNGVSLSLGLMVLAGGTWFICSRLHRIYLWL